METAAKELNFVEAARIRDEFFITRGCEGDAAVGVGRANWRGRKNFSWRKGKISPEFMNLGIH
jgi:UvrB/uvrC motif